MTTHDIYRVSQVYDPPTVDDGRPVDWAPVSETTEVWGSLRIELGAVWGFDGITGAPELVTAGTDVTTFGNPDARTRITNLSFAEPFGETVGSINFPGITPFLDITAMTYLAVGQNVDVYRVLPAWMEPLVPEVSYWHGFIASHEDSTDGGLTLHLAGALFGEAGLRMHHPWMLDSELDCGSAISRILRPGAYARPYPSFRFRFTSDTTTITTRKRGSRGQSALDAVTEFLSMAQDASTQWTVSRAFDVDDNPIPRDYYLRPKSQVQTNYTSVGIPGVVHQLADDLTSSPTAIYGEGVARDGERWRNAAYPNLDPRTPPTFPGVLEYLDEDPIYGAEWILRTQAVMRADGVVDVRLTGIYDLEMVDGVAAVQEDAGLTVDGETIDSDTWDAIWTTSGTGTTDLNSGYFQPLADSNPQYDFYADGSIKGDNASFDPDIMRVEQTLSYGENVSKGKARTNARRLIRREGLFGGYAGTITFDGVSPAEMCAMDIREGGMIQLREFRGRTNVDNEFHVAGVTVQPEARTVTLAVDQKPYDLLALSEKIARNREANADPAKALFNMRSRSSKAWKDAVGWDAESGAGIVPPVDLVAGYNVIKLIGAQYGIVQAIKCRTTSPASRFALALFGKEVTTTDLDGLVADPLAEEPDLYGWWSKPAIQDSLTDFGFIEAWGEFGEACGYWPGRESDDHAVTGKCRDPLNWTFASDEPPWLWLAVWATEACTFDFAARIQVTDE